MIKRQQEQIFVPALEKILNLVHIYFLILMKINADYIVRKDYFFYVTFCKMENLLNNTDYLSRQPYLDLLKSIIANQSNNPPGYSFAIDGEWGCGKTWILTELECQLAEN